MAQSSGPTASGGRHPLFAAGRRLVVHAARIAARTLRAMLPERGEPGAYRAEWARLLAAATVVLPVALIGLTLAARGQLADEPASAGAEALAPGGAAASAGIPPAPDPAGAATGPGEQSAAGDPGAVQPGSVVLLASTEAESLPGAREDDRRIVVAGGVPYVLNATVGRIDRVESGVARPVLVRGQVVGADTVADLVDLVWLAAPGGGGGRVAALDAAGRLWAVDVSPVARIARADAPGWLAVERLAGFDGNLYALDRGTGQIYRFTPDLAGFPSYLTPGGTWLQVAADLAEAVDLAIDGSIQVLFRSGRIAVFAAGVPTAEGGDDPRLATTDARAIYASPTSGRLLIADRAGGRVLVAGPDGAFKAEIRRSPQALSLDASTRAGRFAALTDVWWDEAAGLLYVADGNLLLRAPYR